MKRSRCRNKFHASHQPLYGNCKVFAPDGTLIFRCGTDKVQWYLERGLAEPVQSDPYVSIRLLFEPRGEGWRDDEFYLQERENRCCVCGSSEDLTRHHVVPYCYRRFMADHKKYDYYDILPVCLACHATYERGPVLRLQKQLATQYQAPLPGINLIPYRESEIFAIKLAYSLVHYGDRIPEANKQEMLARIRNRMGDVDLLELSQRSIRFNPHREDYQTHGQLVVSQLTDVYAFVKMWRQHFLEHAKPKFMPQYWDVNRPLAVKHNKRAGLEYQ